MNEFVVHNDYVLAQITKYVMDIQYEKLLTLRLHRINQHFSHILESTFLETIKMTFKFPPGFS